MKKLLFVELRRLWSIPTIVLGCLMVFLGMTFSPLTLYIISLNVTHTAFKLNVSESFLQVQSGIGLLCSAFFAAGIIANDLKSGWMRSLLARPITRQSFLAIKLSVVFASICAVMLIASLLPIGIVAVLQGTVPEFHPLELFQIIIGGFGQILIYVIMSAILSCFLPGNYNLIALFIWGIFGSLSNMLLEKYFWNNRWVFIANELVFPRRLTDFAQSALTQSVSMNDLVWGMASLSMLLAASFYLINTIQTDKTAE